MEDRGHFEDLLDQLEKDVLALDRTGDTSIVHLLFRSVHNLKGSTAQAGLEALSHDIHGLEDMLDKVRRGRMAWDPACFEQVTKVIDAVRIAITGNSPSEARKPPAEPVPAFAPPATSQRWGLDLAAAEIAAGERSRVEGLGLYRLEKLVRQGLAWATFHALPVLDDLREAGTLIAMRPSWETYSAGPAEQVVRLLFASARTSTELAEILFDPLIVLAEPGVPTAAPPHKDALRFLIIEDDPTAGGLLHYILKQHGDCLHCESGNEGISAFRESLAQGRPYDLLVLDLFLPDLHGNEVLKAVRGCEAGAGRRDPDTRCMVLINTASKDLGQMRQSLELEPDGYLIKPINVDFLMEKVATLKAQRLPAV
jgi:CheY-like chemotaxis protein